MTIQQQQPVDVAPSADGTHTVVVGAQVPSELDDYLFDLRGFVLIRGALSRAVVDACNAAIDAIPSDLPRLGWYGAVQREDHPEHRGISYQQVYEAGEPFERLVDHPGYINYALRYVGGGGTWDYNHGPLFIDENFVTLRGPGEAIALHSGGHDSAKRGQYRYRNGRFACGQVNVLIAHTDIGPGDGATMVIPGSHKANLVHPAYGQASRAWEEEGGGSVDNIEGAVEVYMGVGDALVFVDALSHGSAARVNAGQRRISVYRYSPSWARSRWGYRATPALLDRLSPFARSIVEPAGDLLPPVES